MISLRILENPDADWNKRIMKSEFGTFFQTVEYANLYSLRHNSKKIFLVFENNSEIVGQHLLFLQSRGTSSIKKFFGKFLSPIYVWNNSILIFQKNFQNEILQSFTSFIKNKKFMGVDNPLAKYTLDLPKTKNGTVILFLKDTFLETISKRDPTSTQKHIAIAGSQGIPSKKGVTVKMIKTSDDIENYIKMVNLHRKGLKIPQRDPKNVKNFVELVLKFGGGVLAFHNDKPISGIFYILFNGWMHNMGVANTNYSIKNKLSSLDYLRCNLIATGIKSKAKFFDLGGISLNPKNKKEEGILHSQTKWGGKIVLFNRYSNI